MSGDLSNRNADAVRAALQTMNGQLSAMEARVNKLAREVVELNQELKALRQKSIQDMVNQMGAGPTE